MNRVNNRPDLKAKRRALRRSATPAEGALWGLLARHQLGGLKFRRQHSVGPFVLDFYCPSARLAVELDGAVHDDPTRAAYDAEREGYLRQQSIRVLRFENRTVFEMPEGVRAAILRAVEAGLRTDNPSAPAGHLPLAGEAS